MKGWASFKDKISLQWHMQSNLQDTIAKNDKTLLVYVTIKVYVLHTFTTIKSIKWFEEGLRPYWVSFLFFIFKWRPTDINSNNNSFLIIKKSVLLTTTWYSPIHKSWRWEKMCAIPKVAKASPDPGSSRVRGSGQDGSPQNKNNAATRQNAQDTVRTF